jgi:hypothetical protein
MPTEYAVKIIPQLLRGANNYSTLSRESGEEDLGPAGYTAPTTQLVLCLRLALLKGESWLRAASLDDSKKVWL